MPEPTFEQRLGDLVRTHAENGVRPIDAHAIAASTVATGRSSVRWRLARPLTGRGLTPVLVGLLLLALAATAIVIGGRLLRPSPVVSVPEPSASADPSPAETGVRAEAPAEMRRAWVTDLPATLSFPGESGPRRLALDFTPDGTAASVRVSAIPRMSAGADAPGPSEVRFTTSAPGGAINQGGTALPDCAMGDQGRYRWSISADGFLLTLSRIADACAARAAILDRTWAQSLGGDSLGDRGVVDAFAPEFTVTLPHGAFSTIRTSDAIEIWAADESVGFLAWKDPQGFIDSCDSTLGRVPMAPGGEAFVAYLRQHAGIKVLSTTPLTIDGSKATHVVVEALTDFPCALGWVEMYQPKGETSGRTWHLEPGVQDGLYIVDRPDATVMLEVLPLGYPNAASIISSVTFLDGVPPNR